MEISIVIYTITLLRPLLKGSNMNNKHILMYRSFWIYMYFFVGVI